MTISILSCLVAIPQVVPATHKSPRQHFRYALRRRKQQTTDRTLGTADSRQQTGNNIQQAVNSRHQIGDSRQKTSDSDLSCESAAALRPRRFDAEACAGLIACTNSKINISEDPRYWYRWNRRFVACTKTESMRSCNERRQCRTLALVELFTLVVFFFFFFGTVSV